MNYVLGLINLQEDDRFIREITRSRPLGTVPFAGRYRLIDFTLSSMVNSGITSVGVMLPDRSSSVLDHLRSGKDWDLARLRAGLFYISPEKDTKDIYQSELKILYQKINTFRNSPHEYVLLSGSNAVFNMDFNDALRFHQNTGADITMIYYQPEQKLQTPCTVIKTEQTGLIDDISLCNLSADHSNVCMGIYLMSKKVFIDVVEYAYEHCGTDFLADGIMQLTHNYKIYGYMYRGYAALINSLAEYYQFSMQLLTPEIWHALFIAKQPIYTKTKEDLPVKYQEHAHVVNSLIANGCIINGSVTNSILFRDVIVKEGASVKDSIVMQNCQLGEGSSIENVICDKDVKLSSKKHLKGAPNYPFVVEKGASI